MACMNIPSLEVWVKDYSALIAMNKDLISKDKTSVVINQGKLNNSKGKGVQGLGPDRKTPQKESASGERGTGVCL